MFKKHQAKWFMMLTLLFAILFLCYIKHIYNFLSDNRSVEPEIYVIEGWISSDALNAAKNKLLENKNCLMITSGFEYTKGYTMGSNGKLIYDVQDKIKVPLDSLYSFNVTVRGSKADGAYAHFNLYADNVLVGNNFTGKKPKSFNFLCKLDSCPNIVCIEFDNDVYAGSKDRNLIVYSLSINKQVLPNGNESARYFACCKKNELYLKRFYGKSTACDAANYFKSENLPDSQLIAVETRNFHKSKTYSSAVDIKKWLEANMPQESYSITILTQGPHALRSRLSFEKVFQNKANIGAISFPDEELHWSNWWKTINGWKKILYETFGVIYVYLVL